jgi:Tol biopolymer transport system component/tRNA A-37 threonylcarbamoyl transferase component Bud32
LSFAPGARLGPYEIGGPIGAGGMGEVYRASDSKLGRDVAIKVLPATFTQDAERVARFRREAQILASLNHPSIAAIYGLEESEGALALALELVEGEDLAGRLERGPIPVDEAIAVAKQIAEALEEAHGKGIVHRDLKPANVKLKPDGKIKVLDFGLAKAYAGDAATTASTSGLSQSPTLAHAGTQTGIILGSAAYMSPEQARGKPVDKRADIWAFGAVLWEMLTGHRLFAGETVSDVLAGVLKTEIDLGGLPGSAPPAIRRLLRRCLERDPRRRLHDIADARTVLEDLLSGVDGDESGGASCAAVVAPRTRRVSLPWLAALVVSTAGAGLAGYVARGRGATPAAPMRLAIQLSANQELGAEGNSLIVFSPDGGSLVFSGRENGRQSLFRRKLEEPEAVPIPGTEGGESPFFSPDGRWLGFVAEGQMRKVPAEGGRPFPLAEVRGVGGCAWLSDGTIVYAPIYSEGLYRVSAEGGSPERLTTPDHKGGELGHWWPEPLPGGQQVVFTAFRTPVDRSRIGVLDLATREVRWVVDGGFFGRYLPTGHLLFAKGQRLYALPFDGATRTVKGPAVAVVDDVHASQTSGFAQAAVSSRGTLAYITESLGNPVRELVWLDRTGRAVATTPERRRFMSVSLSPDGRRAALTIQGESRDLWTLSLERGTLSRLTSGEGTEFDPVWSRDGRELFYVVDRPPFELHRIAPGAPDSGRPLWDEPAQLDTDGIAVSPDGRTIAFARTEERTGSNLYSRPIDGSEPPRPIRASRGEERGACFSPDGRFIVYQSDETGRPEIYVESFPASGERIQVSSDGGAEPLWAANGEIFYRHDDELRLVAPRRAGRSDFEAPRALFAFPIAPGASNEMRTFDVTRDGARILAVTIPLANRPRQIEVVTNWTSELARLAPRGAR